MNKDHIKAMQSMKFPLFSLLVIFAVSACSGEQTETAGGDEELVKAVNVETKRMDPQVFESYLRLVGTVETSDDIMISAEVSGRVMEYYVDEGETVQKGQTIVKLDDAKLRQELARLEAVTEQARENYERLQRIYEDEGIGSEIDMLNAKYAYQQNKSALESIRVDMANTTIKAPFSGKLETRFLEEGEMAAPGMQVVRLIGSEQYIVSAGVPARYADVVEAGDDVQVWFDTQASDTLSGEISFVAGSINPQNRTFRIEVLLPEERYYKVDMIANLKLSTLREENVIVVSEEFVYKENDSFIMYVKSEDESGNAVAEQRVVELGPSYKTDVIVRDGLSSGDMLITTGSAFLNNGMRLNVLEQKASAE